jgi:hypothetical protein
MYCAANGEFSFRTILIFSGIPPGLSWSCLEQNHDSVEVEKSTMETGALSSNKASFFIQKTKLSLAVSSTDKNSYLRSFIHLVTVFRKYQIFLIPIQPYLHINNCNLLLP